MIRNLSFAASTIRWLPLALSLAGWFFAVPQIAAAKDLRLSILSAGRLSTDLLIGDDLGVDLFGAASGVSYVIALISDTGITVAEQVVVADAEGEVPRQMLWQRSGVVGCDQDSEADSALFRFRDFSEAEQHLAVRMFTLTVTDPQGSAILTNLDLPLVEGGTSRFYFSDSAGCWRCELFADETVFLSGHQVTTSALPWRFLLVPAEPIWLPGSALNEVRAQFEAAPQQIFVPLGQGSFTTEVWASGSLTEGVFDGFVRQAMDDQQVLRGDDVLVGLCLLRDQGYPGGLVIRGTGDRPPCPSCH